jgi:hypothetical protein
MERGDGKEEEELASPSSGAGDKDGIFDARGGDRGPAAAVAGDRRGEAVTGPWQRGRACARSDRGAQLSGQCNWHVGPWLYLNFQWFSITQILKFKKVTLLMSKNTQIL